MPNICFFAGKNQHPKCSMEMHHETYSVPFMCELTYYGSFVSSIQIHGPEKQSSIARLVISAFLTWQALILIRRTCQKQAFFTEISPHLFQKRLYKLIESCNLLCAKASTVVL